LKVISMISEINFYNSTLEISYQTDKDTNQARDTCLWQPLLY
jgi:hypothetical protein